MISKKVLFCGAGLLLTSGCATQGYVNREVKGMDQRHIALNYAQNAEIAKLGGSVRDALDRANAAMGQGMLATIESTDTIVFDRNPTQVSEEARGRLSALAERLMDQKRRFYIEIQGHTDSTGSAAANEIMGNRRAAAVRLAVHEAGIPLRYISTISFGSSKPIASNDTADGRKLNRRAEVIVMY